MQITTKDDFLTHFGGAESKLVSGRCLSEIVLKRVRKIRWGPRREGERKRH